MKRRRRKPCPAKCLCLCHTFGGEHPNQDCREATALTSETLEPSFDDIDWGPHGGDPMFKDVCNGIPALGGECSRGTKGCHVTHGQRTPHDRDDR